MQAQRHALPTISRFMYIALGHTSARQHGRNHNKCCGEAVGRYLGVKVAQTKACQPNKLHSHLQQGHMLQHSQLADVATMLHHAAATQGIDRNAGKTQDAGKTETPQHSLGRASYGGLMQS